MEQTAQRHQAQVTTVLDSSNAGIATLGAEVERQKDYIELLRPFLEVGKKIRLRFLEQAREGMAYERQGDETTARHSHH